ncbi:urate hydroxylase PuuD [Undibacterium sp. Jales W-56]|uniref:urate hydroxylase PuuD n=1 Tax=Undibacterium sp. Jales W-56 TaxID=2897325 RepID=UPI0021D1C8CF|nr:urate hydroxylase PuuD [Undibacterium sp. Jales W-56]MCU6434873.1 urate hydroxylase PuuD [Undibacterium sp. Jales W-56]
MEAYFLDWANLLLRWLHVIVAIAWIGSSFYFVWLDNHLTPPEDAQLKDKGVAGELWAVHGGGFYNPQKYMGAPPKLPQDLHWFYWESYSTWLSGFGLFTVLYLFNAKTYLVDPDVMRLSSAEAVLLALGFLAVGWIVYDLLCRFVSKNEKLLSLSIVSFVIAAAWAACHVFAGRAAFLIVGAMIATIMSANVFFWIIPGQRKIVASMKAGQAVDPIHGQRGKQRSVHNTYFTLPVLFAMMSNHYSMTYTHEANWLVLVLVMLTGVLIRQFFILRHKGTTQAGYPLLAILILAGVAAWIMPKPTTVLTGQAAGDHFAQVQAIINTRCIQCHAAHPTLMDAPAKGLLLDQPELIQTKAQLIYQQVVQTRLMPLGNLTHITEEERALIAQWFERSAGQGIKTGKPADKSVSK